MEKKKLQLIVLLSKNQPSSNSIFYIENLLRDLCSEVLREFLHDFSTQISMISLTSC